METNHIYLQNPDSSSSAVDTTGLGLAAPPSPSFEPSDTRLSLSRRRSWSQRPVDPGQDPLRLNLAHETSTIVRSAQAQYINEDPFNSPTEDRALQKYPYTTDGQRYDSRKHNSSQVESSTVSLIPSGSFRHGHREDDEAHLTENMSRNGVEEVWVSGDMERSAGSARRQTLKYDVTPSPLKKTGSAFRNVSQNLRRMSLRVVNLAGTGLESQLKLDGASDTRDEDEDGIPDPTKTILIRGRTLGFLGPDSKLRLALYKLLIYSYVVFL